MYTFHAEVHYVRYPNNQLQTSSTTYQYLTDDPDFPNNGRNDMRAVMHAADADETWLDTYAQDNQTYGTTYIAGLPLAGSPADNTHVRKGPAVLRFYVTFDVRNADDPGCFFQTASISGQ